MDVAARMGRQSDVTDRIHTDGTAIAWLRSAALQRGDGEATLRCLRGT
jgi:hypothetical protein